MKLRTGKIVKVAKSTASVTNKKAVHSTTRVSRLRNGKTFREEFIPLEWMDMELKYEQYVKIYKKNYGYNKPVLSSSKLQLKDFKKGIHTIIENQKKLTNNEDRIIIVKSCILWMKENINLFFTPGLICEEESYTYLRNHVKWMQFQLDAMNDKRILKKYKEADLIQVTKDFGLIHSMWESI